MLLGLLHLVSLSPWLSFIRSVLMALSGISVSCGGEGAGTLCEKALPKDQLLVLVPCPHVFSHGC